MCDAIWWLTHSKRERYTSFVRGRELRRRKPVPPCCFVGAWRRERAGPNKSKSVIIKSRFFFKEAKAHKVGNNKHELIVESFTSHTIIGIVVVVVHGRKEWMTGCKRAMLLSAGFFSIGRHPREIRLVTIRIEGSSPFDRHCGWIPAAVPFSRKVTKQFRTTAALIRCWLVVQIPRTLVSGRWNLWLLIGWCCWRWTERIPREQLVWAYR